MTLTAANTTYAQIEKMVRQLTAIPSTSALPSSEIQQEVNAIYSQDFPYAIKLDQMRSVYTFYTRPYVDKYPLDVNYNQGVRAPMYVEGIQGSFFKDRNEFYNMWPRWPTKFTPFTGDGTTTVFNFTIPGPFLSENVVFQCVSTSGSILTVSDVVTNNTDSLGNPVGNLYLQTTNPVVSVPPYGSVYTTGSQAGMPIPGMFNVNTLNPGLDSVTTTGAPTYTPTPIGTVNYVTGVFSIDFSIANVIPGTNTATAWVSQYQTGRPYSLLFWNNHFEIRPVPKLVHKVEIETYLTPVQFMNQTDNPILGQWVKYLSYATACELLRRRQDMQGVSNLMEGFKRQEALVLERQAIEEIGSRNATIFAGTTPTQGWNNGFNQGWGG